MQGNIENQNAYGRCRECRAKPGTRTPTGGVGDAEQCRELERPTGCVGIREREAGDEGGHSKSPKKVSKPTSFV
jgi:hypothetical protein